MIRKLLATTAVATLVASGAYAQTDPMTPTEPAVPNIVHADGHLASNIIGQTVYNSSGDDAENIGSVTDLVISSEGEVEAMVVGVGGFLGLGRKDVAIEYDLAEWVERDGNRWLVVTTTREALEGLEDFDANAFRPMPADTVIGNTTPATAEQLGLPPRETDDLAAAPADDELAPPADDDLAAAPADETAPAEDMAQAPADDPLTDTDDTRTSAIDRSGLTDVPAGTLSADEFIGTTVYGMDDENIGSIGDVVLSQDGNVEAVVIDVGGFLGIGAKPVAVGMDNLAFMSDGDGNYHLYTQFTREQLEAQPEYDPATFAEHRDSQILTVPPQ